MSAQSKQFMLLISVMQTGSILQIFKKGLRTVVFEQSCLSIYCTTASVLVIVRALEVCTELNLSAGIEYHGSLIQLNIADPDRAKYVNYFHLQFSVYFAYTP